MSAKSGSPVQNVFAIVLLGKFNPNIFHPLWYAQNGLIPIEEVENVTELICSDEVSTFVYNDIHFQIERHRFGLTTRDESRIFPLRDLVTGTFQILENTPLTAFGFNRDMQFELKDAETWHNVGHRLAPKSPWVDVLRSPGMLIVGMLGTRSDSHRDQVNIRVQPVMNGNHAVQVAINQHHDLDKENSYAERTADAVSLINNDWAQFLTYSVDAAQRLLTARRDEE